MAPLLKTITLNRTITLQAFWARVLKRLRTPFLVCLKKFFLFVRKGRSYQGCELELELEELGNFARIRTRIRKIKISELELELEKSL